MPCKLEQNIKLTFRKVKVTASWGRKEKTQGTLMHRAWVLKNDQITWSKVYPHSRHALCMHFRTRTQPNEGTPLNKSTGALNGGSRESTY